MIDETPGTIYEHRSGLTFVVLRPARGGVLTLILTETTDFPGHYLPGSSLLVLRYSGYWRDSVPIVASERIASLEEQDKVSS